MKKKFGDRKDAYKVRNINPMNKLMYYIKRLRCDSDVYINQTIDVTNLVEFMKEKKKKCDDLTFFHAFCTAIAKVVYHRPLLNRFIMNGNFYDKKTIDIGFVAKTEFSDNAKEFMALITIDKDDNLYKVKDKFVENVNKIRTNSMNDTDGIINTLGNMPKFIRAFVMWIFKKLDNHDLLPESLTKNLLYYSSVIVSNLGSIGGGVIYHNLTDFGSNSILMTIGKIRKAPMVNDNGEVEVKEVCDFGITLDERIADGFYFITAIQLFEEILKNPKLLEDEINEKIK